MTKKMFLVMLVSMICKFAVAGEADNNCAANVIAIIPAHTKIFTIGKDCREINSRGLAVRVNRAVQVVSKVKCPEGTYSIVRMLPTKADPYGDIFAVETDSLIK